MIRKLLLLTIMCSCIVNFMSACSATDEEGTEVSTEPGVMRVPYYHVLTSTEVKTSGLKLAPPCFTFWHAATFLTQNGATCDFYCAVTATDSVPAYSATNGTDAEDQTTWFDTQLPYPNNDQSVLASGFFPASIGSEEDLYKVLTLKPEMLARDTVWVARGSVLGSTFNNFSRALPFVHATARVIFKAKGHKDMQYRVRDVQLSLPKTEVLYRMEWRPYHIGTDLEDSCLYLPLPYDEAVDLNPDNFTSKQWTAFEAALQGSLHSKFLPTDFLVQSGSDDPMALDTFYIRPEVSEMRLNVDAQMVRGGKNTTYKATNLRVPFVDEDKTPLVLHAGDSYEVTLNFNNIDIELEGRKLDFDEGGNVYIAIQPFL